MANFLKTTLLSVLAFALVSCGEKSKPEPTSEGKPRIVATTTMLADMAQQIAGEDAEVIALMAPGVDPHTYELPARAIGQLNSADLVIYNGILLEGKMEEMFKALASKGKAVVSAAESLPENQILHPAELEEAHGDPHVWGDAALWANTIPAVTAEVVRLLPDDRKLAAKENAARYTAEIAALDEWIAKRIALIPKEHRLVVTSHDAFSYLGKAYDLEVVGVQGISTATEAGIADIVSTVDLVKKRGVKAIFVESSVSTSTIERIATDAGVKIGGKLFSDSCGPSGEMKSFGGETYDVGTYIGMMKHNVNTVVEALK